MSYVVLINAYHSHFLISCACTLWVPCGREHLKLYYFFKTLKSRILEGIIVIILVFPLINRACRTNAYKINP